MATKRKRGKSTQHGRAAGPKAAKAGSKPVSPRLSAVALKWCEYGRATADEVFRTQTARLKRQAAELAQRAEAMAAVDASGRPLYPGRLAVKAAAGFLVAQGESSFSYRSGSI